LILQGTPVKDVTLPENAPKTLLLQKHADYIAAYGNKKNDYVSHKQTLLILCTILFFHGVIFVVIISDSDDDH
jgi:hypothetical protein